MNSRKRKFNTNYVRTGWFALHSSVCMKAEYGEFRSYIDVKFYEALLKPILDTLKISPFVQGQDETVIGDVVWSFIRMAIRQHALNKNNGGVFERASINEFVVIYSEWAKNKPSRDSISISLRDPLSALQIGWFLIDRPLTLKAKDRYIDFFWGLALIGWVSVIHSKIKVCKLCFRWTFYGSDHCFQHAQSKLLNRSPADAHSQYRIAKKNLQFAAQDTFYYKYPNPIPISTHTTSLIADYIFFDTYDENDLSEIYDTLNLCPLALSFLGGPSIFKMEIKDLIVHLRKCINPLENLPQALLLNIVLLETELNIVKKVAGRPKGQSQRTGRLVIKAIELAEEGYSKKEIAIKLEIKKNTLSNRIKRYPKLAAAFNNNSYTEIGN